MLPKLRADFLFTFRPLEETRFASIALRANCMFALLVAPVFFFVFFPEASLDFSVRAQRHR